MLIWQRLKLVVEPSAALPLAAVMKDTTMDGGEKLLKDCHRIGLILCGGNVHIREDVLFG
jgi:threonine dehydratase